jgi:hypothetical protein
MVASTLRMDLECILGEVMGMKEVLVCWKGCERLNRVARGACFPPAKMLVYDRARKHCDLEDKCSYNGILTVPFYNGTGRIVKPKPN